MNITDVGHLVSDEDEGQDKMVKSALKHKKTAWELAQYYSDDFMAGMDKLHLVQPQHITKATDFIDEQLTFIRELKDKGVTYQIDDGIYFDTAKFPNYASFARLDLEHLKDGARITPNPQKRNPSDFALWKFSPKHEKRDMEWDTPKDIVEGTSKKGFPGWHLECSAMILNKLGKTIDIHTGGIDHIPVHHTNEIAQSETLTGKPLAHYWLHNNFLLVNGTKVSKSLGNSILLSEIEKKNIDLMAFKLFVLQSHYRTESNFTWENLVAANNRLNNWASIIERKWQVNTTSTSDSKVSVALASALDALQQDLDTPRALIHVEEALRYIETRGLEASPEDIMEVEAFIQNGLGLYLHSSDITAGQKLTIKERADARKKSDWKTSDHLRDILKNQKILLKDTDEGQIWSRLQ
jgi:cysteinyl-tRNA synthetase